MIQSFCISAAAQWFFSKNFGHSRRRSPPVKAALNLGLFVTRRTCKRPRKLLHPDLVLGSGLEDLKRWRLFPLLNHITHLSLWDSCLSFLAVSSNKNVSDWFKDTLQMYKKNPEGRNGWISVAVKLQAKWKFVIITCQILVFRTGGTVGEVVYNIRGGNQDRNELIQEVNVPTSSEDIRKWPRCSRGNFLSLTGLTQITEIQQSPLLFLLVFFLLCFCFLEKWTMMTAEVCSETPISHSLVLTINRELVSGS